MEIREHQWNNVAWVRGVRRSRSKSWDWCHGPSLLYLEGWPLRKLFVPSHGALRLNNLRMKKRRDHSEYPPPLQQHLYVVWLDLNPKRLSYERKDSSISSEETETPYMPTVHHGWDTQSKQTRHIYRQWIQTTRSQITKRCHKSVT